MTTTSTSPLDTQERPADESESEAPRRQGRFSRGLLAATVAAVAAITGGVLWLTAGSGGDEPSQPVQVVQDGGSQFGSADSLEHHAENEGQFGSADSLEHQAENRAQ